MNGCRKRVTAGHNKSFKIEAELKSLHGQIYEFVIRSNGELIATKLIEGLSKRTIVAYAQPKLMKCKQNPSLQDFEPELEYYAPSPCFLQLSHNQKPLSIKRNALHAYP